MQWRGNNTKVSTREKLNKLNPLKYVDDYWDWLNTPDDNPKIQKAKQEIIDVTYPLVFGIGALLISWWFVKIEGIEDKQGSGFIMFFMVVIYLVWVFVILHTRKNRKRHSHQVQAESYQPLHV